MRILVVGAGGVGSAFAPIAARRDFYEHIVFADIDEAKARSIVDRYGAGGRYSAAAIDATDTAQVVDCARANGCDAISNAADPRFVMPIFNGALEVGATYLDMAMSLSEPHPSAPHEETGEEARRRSVRGCRRVGEPRTAGARRDRHRARRRGRVRPIRRRRVVPRDGRDRARDGANIVIEGDVFAPTFSIWTTIEECLNPPVIWEKGRGWFTTEPFSEPEVFEFPTGSARSSA
jgi:saccharopine dehydrogenase-like NADP-dependent oxidoreductase